MHDAALPKSPGRGVFEQHEIVEIRGWFNSGSRVIVSNEAKTLARRLGWHGI